MGRTYRTATEIVVPDVAASEDYLEADSGVVAEACFPVLAGGLTVGVLNVESVRRCRTRPRDLRDCARALGGASSSSAGCRTESATQRLRRHVADLAALQDADAVADAPAERRARPVPLGSALLARTTGATARLRPSWRPARWRRSCATPSSSRRRMGPGRHLVLHRRRARAPPAATSPTLRAAGVETLVAVGLCVPRSCSGPDPRDPRAGRITADQVELLELLATHGAGCARTLSDRRAAQPRRDRPAHRPRPPRDLPSGAGRRGPRGTTSRC